MWDKSTNFTKRYGTYIKLPDYLYLLVFFYFFLSKITNKEECGCVRLKLNYFGLWIDQRLAIDTDRNFLFFFFGIDWNELYDVKKMWKIKTFLNKNLGVNKVLSLNMYIYSGIYTSF
jgi:hypothetical protein